MKLKLALFVIFALILLIPLLVSPIPKCNAQQTGLTVTFDEYGWTSDMKHVSMTTPERGLIFAITIYNNSTEPFDIEQGSYSHYLSIFINIKNDDNPQFSSFLKTLAFDSNNGGLYLPPYQSEVRYVKVADSMGNNLPIGSYSAELSYLNYNPLSVGSQGTPIAPYPFNFKIETESILQQAIQANKNSGTIINFGPFNFTLFDVSIGGGISITVFSLAVAAYLLNRKKKRK